MIIELKYDLRVFRINLYSFSLDHLTVSGLMIELQSIRIQFNVFALPCLQERSAQLQNLSLYYAVGRHDYLE